MNPTQPPNGNLLDSLLPPERPAIFSGDPLKHLGYVRDFLLAIVIAAIYFGVAKLGLSLAFIHANVSPVWPPTGVAIAAVLLMGYRIWPGILLGAFLANLSTSVPIAAAGGIAIGNTMEALAAGFLLRVLDFRESFERAKDVFKFVVAALFCTVVSATVGNLSLCLGHSAAWQNFGGLWLTWWLGDTIGALVVTPLLLTWVSGTGHWLPKKRYLEATILLSLLAVSAIATFGGPFPIPLKYYPLIRLTVPFFLWAAFRLGQRGVTLATLTVSVFAIWGTAHGFGPFVDRTPNESLLLLQAFIGSNAVMFLFLAAVVEERRRTEEILREGERCLAGNLAITRILAESPALSVATPRILQTIGETFGWEVGDMWSLNPEASVLRCLTVWRAPAANVDRFEAVSRGHAFVPGVGLPGRVWTSLKPVWIPDVTKDPNFPRAPVAVAEGIHSAFAFPILSGDKLLGVMEFFSSEIREPDDALLQMFSSIGTQIGQFMERRQAEESLNELNAQLRQKVTELNTLLEILPVGVWIGDRECKRIEGNRAAYEAFGLPLGINASLSMPPDDAMRGITCRVDGMEIKGIQDLPMQRVARTGLPLKNFEHDLVFPDGTKKTVYASVAPLFDEDGQVRSVIGAYADISERKRVEEALRESQAQLAHMIGSAMDAIITIDADQRIVIFNAAAEKMFHCSADEAIGYSIDRFIPARFRATHRNHIRAFGETGVTDRSMGALGALFGSRTDGHEFPIEASISQIKVKGEKLYTVILRDITERRRAEEEREELLNREQAARTEAEAANRLKDEFLAMLSHELRTPLVAILGWSTTVLASSQRDEALITHALEVIKRNARLQTRIIEDMLDVSRIVAGKLQFDIRPVDLPSVIEAAIGTVQPSADTKGVHLQLTLHSAIRPVLGDPQRLQQVVWNLLSNAIKFTSTGGQVEIRIKEVGANAQITVSDTGEGIKAEFLPHIFDRFRQADSSTTRKHGGLGLGLAIVRHLVELQNGTVQAYSAGEGQGAVFTVTLPVIASHTNTLLQEPHLQNGVPGDDTVALFGLRILYVEDDSDSREALAAGLLLHGAQVRSVASVREALAVLSEWEPDVLLSDIGLPDKDGLDLIRKIRNRLPRDGGTIPAIALTGYVGIHEHNQALSAGYQKCLVKPIEPGNLAEVIRTFVGNGEKRPDGNL